jgi:hypothetical protein
MVYDTARFDDAVALAMSTERVLADERVPAS